MRRATLLFLLLTLFSQLVAQQDAYLAEETFDLSAVPTFILPTQNNAQLQASELAARAPGRAPQYAINLPVNITPESHGQWSKSGTDRLVWRLRVHSKDAHSLNLGFTDFQLPNGAILLLYPPDRSKIYGPFTPADNEDHAALWTPAIPGEELIIELNLPAKEKDNIRLVLSFINHDFLGFAKVVSGNCNLDVVCGVLDSWDAVEPFREVIQSVGLISVGGSTLCTGFLVNNGLQDCTPYFITANHCEIDRDQARTMVVYWNYQNSFCRWPNSFDSGRPGDGVLDVFNTGAIFLASSDQSDFTLVRLDDPVVKEANAFFAGWDASDRVPDDGAVCIHHPLTEEKRISFSSKPLFVGRWSQGGSPVPNGNHLIVPSWDIGTTEDGSSGGPLFNQKGQAIGQLHGGRAACGNDEFDSFGWFHSSWKDGASAASRLSDWLDPENANLSSMEGMWAAQCYISILAENANQQTCYPDQSTFDLIVSDAFRGPVNLVIDYLPEQLEASLVSESAAPGDTIQLMINVKANTPPATYPIVIKGFSGEDTVFTDLKLQVAIKPASFDLSFPDKKSQEVSTSVVLQWEQSMLANNYEVQIALDENFSSILDRVVTTDTFFYAQNLDFETQYYWRVLASNFCGATNSEVAGSFKTVPDISVLILNQEEEACQEDILDFEIQLGDGFRAASVLSYTLSPAIPGVNFSFDKEINQLSGGDVIKVQITPEQSISPNQYDLILQVSDQDRIGAAIVNFEIKQAPPSARLSFPVEAAVLLEEDVHFEWQFTGEVDRFLFELSEDADFSTLLEQQEVQNASYHVKLATGRYYWRVHTINECGTTTSISNQFRVRREGLQQINGKKVALEPNPSSGIVLLRFSEPLEKASIDILNINGQLLQQSFIAEDVLLKAINLSDYPAGVYLVRVKEKKTSITKKLILQR